MPPVLLLDEPLSGLDPMVRESIVKSLLTYLELEKQTVIIATHEIQEIEQILDEVIVVFNGRIEEKRMSKNFVKNPDCRFYNGLNSLSKKNHNSSSNGGRRSVWKHCCN